MTDETKPLSLAAARAKRSNNSTDWDVRTMLEVVQKQLDAGDIRADGAIVVLAHRDERGILVPGITSFSGIGTLEAFGMLDAGKLVIIGQGSTG